MDFGKKGHPWELIYKHLAFIQLDLDNIEEAKEYIKKAELVDCGIRQIISAIMNNGMRQFYQRIGDKDKENDYMNKLMSCLKEINNDWHDKIENTNGEEQEEVLREIFRYMYD